MIALLFHWGLNIESAPLTFDLRRNLDSLHVLVQQDLMSDHKADSIVEPLLFCIRVMIYFHAFVFLVITY